MMGKFKFLENLAKNSEPDPDDPDEAGGVDGQGGQRQGGARRQGPVVDEALARQLGWVPKEEWTRDPDKYQDLDSFIADIPAKAVKYRQTNLSLREQMRRQAEAAARGFEEQTRAAKGQAKARLVTAIDAGDQDAARAAAADLDKVAEAPPEVRGWIAKNPWFTTDPDANVLAVKITNRLAAEGRSTADQLAEAERQVRRRFPELFELDDDSPASVQVQPASRQDDRGQGGQKTLTAAADRLKRPIPQMAGGSGARAPSRPAGPKTFADIPAATRKVFKETLGKKGMSDDTYAKAYWASEGQIDDDD